jgi:hypothetical protein
MPPIGRGNPVANDVAAPRGWRVRIAILWGLAIVLAGAGFALLYDYGLRVVAINQAYLDSQLQERELRSIDQQWQVAGLINGIATPLLGAALLVTLIALAVQARGWQLTRERARARRPDRLAR